MYHLFHFISYLFLVVFQGFFYKQQSVNNFTLLTGILARVRVIRILSP